MSGIEQEIELVQALERARAIKIIKDVMSLTIGGSELIAPTPFQSGYQMACEEAIYRIENEIWELNLPPEGVVVGETE